MQVFPLWEFTDTITRTQHVPVEFLLIINEKTWQSLDYARRTAIAGAAAELSFRCVSNSAEKWRPDSGFCQQQGVRGSEDLTPDQVVEWRACSAGLIADYMDKSGEFATGFITAAPAGCNSTILPNRAGLRWLQGAVSPTTAR